VEKSVESVHNFVNNPGKTGVGDGLVVDKSGKFTTFTAFLR